MSELTAELPKNVALKWRAFLASDEGQFGIDWLRRNYRRMTGSETDAQLLRSASLLHGYMDALDDIQDRLTILPQRHASIDEPALETFDPR